MGQNTSEGASMEIEQLWRHGDEKLDRDDAVEGLIDMLRRLIGG